MKTTTYPPLTRRQRQSRTQQTHLPKGTYIITVIMVACLFAVILFVQDMFPKRPVYAFTEHRPAESVGPHNGITTVAIQSVSRLTEQVPSSAFLAAILAELTTNHVSDRFSPVILWRDDKPIGEGAYFIDSEEGPVVSTTAHHFEKSGSSMFSFQVIRPWSDVRQPINRLKEFTAEALDPREGTHYVDYVLCIPGEPRPIEGFDWLTATNSVETPRIHRIRTWERPPKLTSLVSGKEIEMEGRGLMGNLWEHCLFKFPEQAPGRSGRGFISSENDTALYLNQGQARIQRSHTQPEEALAFAIRARVR